MIYYFEDPKNFLGYRAKQKNAEDIQLYDGFLDNGAIAHAYFIAVKVSSEDNIYRIFKDRQLGKVGIVSEDVFRQSFYSNMFAFCSRAGFPITSEVVKTEQEKLEAGFNEILSLDNK